MAPTILVAIAAGIAIYAFIFYRQFARHIAEAKASGLPYVVVPFFLVNRFYQISCFILLPIFRSLPNSWTEEWLDLTVEWGWKRRYEPFAKIGADTFLTVCPERIVLCTAEASVISQISNRRNDFPKALEVYGSLKIYGENVVVVEGQRWRHHRKITSPPFSEKNNGLVWQETLDQTMAMVGSWFDGPRATESRTLSTIAEDAMRLSLHIISRAGFGVPLEWPKDGEDGEHPGDKLENGHTMTYTDALGSLLHNILWLLALPRGLLSEYLHLTSTPQNTDSMLSRDPTLRSSQTCVKIIPRMGTVYVGNVCPKEKIRAQQQEPRSERPHGSHDQERKRNIRPYNADPL